MPNSILYLSPAIPSRSGYGLTMRAASNLAAVAAVATVDLAVISARDDLDESDIPEDVRAMCRDVALVRIDRETSAVYRWIAGLENQQMQLMAEALYPLPIALAPYCLAADWAADRILPDRSWDAIHTFRLRMAPIALSKRFSAPRDGGGASGDTGGADSEVAKVLDLDDLEWKVQRRAVETMRDTLGRQITFARLREAAKLERWAGGVLPEFDQIYVCSEGDRTEYLAERPGTDVRVVPNVVPFPETVPAPRARADDAPFVLLFVGTMTYEPNVDAALFICEEILPALRQKAPGRFRIRIVGRRPPDRVQRLAEHEEVDVIADAPEIEPEYDGCDAVMAPLRFAGGTRIKILEAFGRGRPVISTTIGAEGITADPGQDLLIADTADAFADRIVDLMDDPPRAAAIATAGRRLVERDYGPETVHGAIAAGYDAVAKKVGGA